jgi:hypothetical protein
MWKITRTFAEQKDSVTMLSIATPQPDVTP